METENLPLDDECDLTDPVNLRAMLRYLQAEREALDEEWRRLHAERDPPKRASPRPESPAPKKHKGCGGSKVTPSCTAHECVLIWCLLMRDDRDFVAAGDEVAGLKLSPAGCTLSQLQEWVRENAGEPDFFAKLHFENVEESVERSLRSFLQCDFSHAEDHFDTTVESLVKFVTRAAAAYVSERYPDRAKYYARNRGVRIKRGALAPTKYVPELFAWARRECPEVLAHVKPG